MIWCRSIALAVLAFSALSVRAQFIDDLAQTRLAAEKGDPKAQTKYADACFGSFRYEEGVRWYQIAAEKGVARAQRQLGQALLDGCGPFPGRSARVPADPVLGVKWLTQAAAQRDAQAMAALGQCYEKGRGVHPSLVEAFKWYSLASEHSDLMGGIYRNQLVPRLTPDQLRDGEALVDSAREGAETVPSAQWVGIGLKGISGSKERRLALINNASFAAGETGFIKVGGQSILITCVEIDQDSVVVSMGGGAGMTRLKLGGSAEPVTSPRQPASGQPTGTPVQSPDNARERVSSERPSPSLGTGEAASRQVSAMTPAPGGIGAIGVSETRALLSKTIIIAGFLFAVLVAYWIIARRNKRDAESLRKLFGHRPADASAGSNACPESDDLRNWFQQHDRPPPGPGNALLRDRHRPVPVTAILTIDEVIQRIRNLDWFQFEKIIGVIYGQLGYAVSRRGGANPDGGIDLVITRDGESIAVQCKHWKAWEIKLRTVREFLGALADSNISKGFIVTLAGHTNDAGKLADKHGIVFVNETSLRDMLRRIGATANPKLLDILNDTRKFCPKCEAEMILRTSENGRGAGAQFWGCSTYPKCRYTMPLEQAAA